MMQNDELQLLYDQVATSEEELVAQNESLLYYQKNLELKALIDQLTGLNNRLALEKYVKTFLSKDVMRIHKLLIAFLDLDNFKYINSNFGHYVGDVIL